MSTWRRHLAFLFTCTVAPRLLLALPQTRARLFSLRKPESSKTRLRCADAKQMRGWREIANRPCVASTLSSKGKLRQLCANSGSRDSVLASVLTRLPAGAWRLEALSRNHLTLFVSPPSLPPFVDQEACLLLALSPRRADLSGLFVGLPVPFSG